MSALMGQKIVIVGGSSGIGLGIAAAAIKSSADVVIVGRSAEKLQAAGRSLGADRRVRSLAVDMTKEAEVARMFDEVGAFDHLVSTAGAPPPGDPIDRTDMDVVRRFVDNKLIGAVVAAIAGSFSYFARALALELAPTRVNIVSPGWVDTPMWDELVGEAKSHFFVEMAARLPAKRIATLADVAAAYLYLMESELTTGETIRIDGGQSLI